MARSRIATLTTIAFSTGGKTNKDIKTWKDSFANQMYFMPGIDDTPGFWESHPAWWDYWEDLIDGAMVWESAWPQVHETTKDGDMSRDLKVIGPLQKAGKGYMIAVSLLQYKNSVSLLSTARYWLTCELSVWCKPLSPW